MTDTEEPLDRLPPSPPVSMQSRYLWMTDGDWRAFAAALHEVFPEARYWVSGQGPREVTGVPIILQFFHDLYSAGGWGSHSTHMVFDPRWQPDFIRYRPYPEEPDHLRWIIRNYARPSILFHGTRWPRRHDELQSQMRLGYGQLTFYADPKDKAQALLHSRVFRLLGKFTSNRNQAYYRMPEREFIRVQDKGSQFWVGHEARAWALADPRRLFFYNVRAWAFRPVD